MGELKPKMAASLRKIRDVFIHDWDPLGIGSAPDWPQDEYESYVMPVYTILRTQKGDAALRQYLSHVYQSILGLTVAPDEFHDVAAQFLRIDVSEDEIHQ